MSNNVRPPVARVLAGTALMLLNRLIWPRPDHVPLSSPTVMKERDAMSLQSMQRECLYRIERDFADFATKLGVIWVDDLGVPLQIFLALHRLIAYRAMQLPRLRVHPLHMPLQRFVICKWEVAMQADAWVLNLHCSHRPLQTGGVWPVFHRCTRHVHLGL